MKVYYSITILLLLSSGLMGQRFNSALPVPSQEKLRLVATAVPRPGGPTTIRPVIDLSPLLPTPGMQGFTQGSCAAWATGYGMMTYLKKKQQRWSLTTTGQNINKLHVYSPAYVYNSLKPNNTCTSGILLLDAMNFCQDNGSLPWQSFPYDTGSCGRTPDPQEFAAAADNRLLSFNKIFSDFGGLSANLNAVKSALNDSLVLPIGVHVDPSFNMNTYGDRSGGPGTRFKWDHFAPDGSVFDPGQYHAMLCVGYDEAFQAFKVLNSWDTSFGNDGYVWISYDVFEQAVREIYAPVIRPPGISLAPMAGGVRQPLDLFKKQNLAGNSITDKNWIKKGYYRDYSNLRVSCLYLSPLFKFAVVRLSNADSNATITTVVLRVGKDYQQFAYQGYDISIKATSIGHAGKNPLTQAVFYELVYKSQSGESFY